jgi:uncharacterized membrane protein
MFSEIKENGLQWAIIIVAFLLFSLYIYENRGMFIVPREMEHTVVNQNKSDGIIGEILKDNTIVQTFVSNKDQFSRIQLAFATYKRQNQGTVTFELKDMNNGKIISTQEIDVSKVPDGINQNIDFPVVNGAKGKLFQFQLSSNDLISGNTVTLWRSTEDFYQDGQLTINGHQEKNDLYFKVMNVKIKPLLSKQEFVLYGISFLLLFILLFLGIRRYKDQMHKVFLITAIPVGLTLVLIVPPFDQLDESEHFFRSFEVSDGLFINHVDNQGKLGNYIPVNIVDAVNDIRYIHQSGYKYSLVKEEFTKTLNPSDRIFKRNYASSYPPIIYIPQALGMILGKVFFNSPLVMMFMGRILNLFAYCAIVYVALKIVPIKKNLFFVLGLIPMAIIHASSLSADALTNSSALLFVAYLLYLAYGKVEKIRTKHIIITISIGLFIALSKIVYFPMVFLFLLIPFSKFNGKKDYLIKSIFVVIGCLLPFIIWNLLNIANLSVPDLRIHAGVSPKDQVHFVLTHPLQYLKILIDAIVSQANSQIAEMTGVYATNYLFKAPSIVIYTFIFLFFTLGIINDEQDLNVKVRRIDRIIFLFIFLTVYILIFTALYVGYNTVGDPLIGGVQGRYFIPIAVFFFLSLSDFKIINSNKKANFLVATLVHMCLFTLLLSYIININS